MEKTTIKINCNVLKIFLLLFPIIKPTGAALEALFGGSLSGYIYLGLRIWNYISIACVVLMFIQRPKKKNISGIILTILFSCVLSISSIIMGEINLLYLYEVFGTIIMLFMLANIYSGDCIVHYIKAAYLYITVIMFLNSICIYKYYPYGLYHSGLNFNYYLFGLDNVGFMYAIVGCFLGILYYIVEEKKISLKFVVVYTFILGAYLYVRAGTATMIILMLILLMILYKMNLLKVLDYRKTMLVCIIAYFMIVIFQTLGVFEWVLSLIKKSTGFNGRTYIWNAMFSAWPAHKWFGFGISTEITQRYLGQNGPAWLGEIGHLHNIILEFLFKGGIIACTFFGMLWAFVYKNMMKYKEHPIAILLCIETLLVWFTCMFEFRFDTYTFWFIPICLYSMKDLIHCYEKH